MRFLMGVLAGNTGPRCLAYSDYSGLRVWSLLSFCTLIIAAKVMPGVMMITGAANSFSTEAIEARTPMPSITTMTGLLGACKSQ